MITGVFVYMIKRRYQYDIITSKRGNFMAKWVLAAKRADFNALSEKFHISPVLARIIRNRDVVTDDEYEMYLNGTLDDLHDGRSMTDMVKACSLIQQYILEGKTFRIIGDYDIDGVCATYILLKGLSACGADVDYAIPHRITDGYGLNTNLVEQAHNDNKEVIITCDNGIAASSQIAYANDLGMHVIVTDHHEVPFEEDEDTGERIELLPPAEAVVDPHREGDNYPFAGICGAVVAWKLVQVLLPMCGIDRSEAKVLVQELLEEAAIATVGDVMELQGENRVIVREGLRRLNNTSNIGLKALKRANALDSKTISAYHIGFVLGPCINASGRLDSAAIALELLLSSDPVRAAQIADELKALNDSRKSMTEQGVLRAVEDIENTTLRTNRVLIVYLPEVHESIAGIIAGRIRERYEKPTIVMTDGEEGIKGSGRSVEAYNMFEELSKHKELFTKFGGHKMAAGLSMPLENLEEFRRCMEEDCTLTQDDLTTKTVIDIALPMTYVSERFINELSMLEPHGNGNPKPVFAQKDLMITKARVVGKNRNLLLLSSVDSDGNEFELKIFNRTDEFMDEVDAVYGAGTSGDLYEGESSEVIMDVIYYPGINEFGGRRTLEYIVNDYRFSSFQR